MGYCTILIPVYNNRYIYHIVILFINAGIIAYINAGPILAHFSLMLQSYIS